MVSNLNIFIDWYDSLWRPGCAKVLIALQYVISPHKLI
jgi:hypothetical protein